RRLRTLEYAAGIDANLTIRIRNVGSVAHQTAGFWKVTHTKRRRNGIARRQVCKLYPPDGEIGVATDKKRVYPLTSDRCKSSIDLAASAGVVDLGLQPHGACSRLHLGHRRRGRLNICRIGEHGDPSRGGYDLSQ